MGIKIFKMVIVYWVFPTEDWAVIGMFALDLEYNWRRIIINQIIYNLPLFAMSGMLLTFLSSLSWLGESYSIHSVLIDHFSYNKCLAFAIVYEIFIVFMIPSLMDWIEEGSQELDPNLLEKE